MEDYPKLSSTPKARERVNRAALKRVVDHFGGSNAKMAAYLGLTRQNTAIWPEVPPKYVRELAEKTGLSVWDVLPDPFPYPKPKRTSDEKAEQCKGREKGRSGRQAGAPQGPSGKSRSKGLGKE